MASCQFLFHQKWQHLRDPHVRALAWLLTAPDLLDARAPVWGGAIACVPVDDQKKLAEWLQQLDEKPTLLHESLKLHQQHRLGVYAEKLLEFYLRHVGTLYARGVQVRDAHTRTLGEFDFLVHEAGGLLHWELATKFYLFLPELPQGALLPELDDYLGPNLSDTLALKMHKILDQQLRLGLKEEAGAFLPLPVSRAQALIKGWLFYRDLAQSRTAALVPGIFPEHCRGNIWTLSDLQRLDFAHAAILPRLQWLPPAQLHPEQVGDKHGTLNKLERHFSSEHAPVMLALMRPHGEYLQESSRGMVVSEAWLKAAEKMRRQFRGES